MSVIAGSRTEKLNFIILAPRLSASGNTENHSHHDSIIHKLKTGITTDDYFIRFNAEHGTQKLLGFRNTVKNTVVTAVGPVRSDTVSEIVLKHGRCKSELSGRRLSACHIQFQALRLILCMFLLKLGQKLFKLFHR